MPGRRTGRPRERRARPETPPDIERYILAQRPQYRLVLRLVRKLIKDTLPRVEEELKRGQPCYRTGREKVACLLVIEDHVNLGFVRGAELEDPKGLLEGAGNGVRHVRIRIPSDIKRREIATVLKHAAELAATPAAVPRASETVQ